MLRWDFDLGFLDQRSWFLLAIGLHPLSHLDALLLELMVGKFLMGVHAFSPLFTAEMEFVG
jgi:hypothetical protein